MLVCAFCEYETLGTILTIQFLSNLVVSLKAPCFLFAPFFQSYEA